MTEEQSIAMRFILETIKEKSRCKNCGGDIVDSVCVSCDKKSDEIIFWQEKLANAIAKVDILHLKESKDIMNMLYSLRHLKIKTIDDLIIQTGYDDIVKSKYINICEKINNYLELTEEEYQDYEFLFDNYEKEENKIHCCNYVIKSVLLGKGKFSYKFIKNMFVCFAEKIALEFGLNCSCKIEKLDNKICGGYLGMSIRLNENLIDSFFNHKNNGIIGTIFHEITHILQDKSQRASLVVCINDYIQIKDRIISNEDRYYYYRNYINLSYEKEARLNGDIYLARYLDHLFNVSKRDEKEVLERISLTLVQDKEILRLHGKNEIELDDRVEEISSKNSGYLREYPSLKYEYKISGDNLIVRKGFEELKEDFLNIDTTNLDEDSIKTLSELYMYLMKKAKLKEDRKNY